MAHSPLLALPLLVLGVAKYEAIEIIDTHVHNFFGTSEISYSFPKAFPDLARRTWNMSDFVSATGRGSGVSAMLMELDKEGDLFSQSLLEAKMYQEAAEYCRASHGYCSVSGIIASAPVTDGADTMRRFLPRLLRDAPLVRGVREALWHRSASSFVNQTYYESLKQLAAHNLTFDVLVNRTQLADLKQLVVALPELRINVNHVAYPDIKAEKFDQAWAAGMRDLAALPNVYVKLSGLPQAYKGKGWTAAEFRPYIRFVLEEFGPKRVNFAGNWFVLNEYGDYKDMLSAVLECVTADLNADSIQEVMAGTAKRLYRLDHIDNSLLEYV
jgi:L-fuconolactonase